MAQEIIRIRLAMPYRMGSVNCYLVKTDTGYILIDTGSSNKRTDIERELGRFGCKPGNLKLILLTHGDFDHSGNAAYIRKKFDSKIAIHPEDSQIVERGNMFSNRKKGNLIFGMIIRTLFGFDKSKRFKADLYVTDGFDLSEYGLDAKVVHIPGHSKGSIGIVTNDGKLICGDLLVNSDNLNQPRINPIMDGLETAKNSVEIFNNLGIDMVYPGHGKPFKMLSFFNNHTDSF